MRKRLALLILLLAMACTCLPAQAAVKKIDNCVLIVNGEETELSEGALYLSGSKVLVPVKAFAEALGYTCSIEGNDAVLRGSNDKEITLRVGVKKAKLGTKKTKTLRVKTQEIGGVMMADIYAFGLAGAKYKKYAYSTAKKKGYSGPVLVVADTTQGSVALPYKSIDEGALPEAARKAAQVSDQIVTVAYNSSTKKAYMSLYEKVNGKWKLSLSPTRVYVGKNGMGKTKEGDGKTPIGTFDLKQPFGIKADPGTTLGNYVKVTKYHYWSGTAGKYYNKMVDISKTDYKPTSADEHLINIKPQYNYCMLIDYNSSCEKGKGSAIFLHCKGKNAYTGGCVAADESVVKSLLKTLRAGAKIVIYTE